LIFDFGLWNFCLFLRQQHAMQRKYYLLLTAAYVLFLSALYLTPASAFPRTSLPGLDKLVHFSTYGIFSWLMLAALGRCPLRWRSLAPWVFVIAFAHAYWMEFLQGIWPSLNRAPSYYDLAAGAAGALSGIVLRLRYAYKRCNCSASVNFPEKPLQKTYPAHSGSQESPALITHHPKLSGIVAQAFGWKAMQVQSAKGWQLGLICTGKSLVSLPHFSYGALYADTALAKPDDEVEAYVKQLHFDKGFAGLEYRRLAKASESDAYKVASWLKLQPDFEAQWKDFSPNLRRKIKRGESHGFEVIFGGVELLNAFYGVYARHMRKLGSGALKKRFFELLLHDYHGQQGGFAGIFVLKLKGKAIGGAFNLAYGGFYENGWFATFHSYQPQYASYVLHKAMIAHAIGLGCHTYSFGRSTTGGGVHLFKKQWNTFDVPLHWISYPEAVVNMRQQGWIRKLWKRIPYPLGNAVGNYIAKWVY
jgi:VanZ family protein